MEESQGPLAPTPPQSTVGKAAPRRRRMSPKTVKLIRRVHLYLGLVLVPWVLLYGATAVLFNHGDWFTERHYSAVEAIPLDTYPTAESLAEQAVSGLGTEGIELLPGTARFVGHFSFRGKNDSHRARVSLASDGSGGMLRMGPTSAKGPDWASALDDWAPIPKTMKRALETNALAVANDQGAAMKALRLRSYPSVRFQVRDQGVLRTVEVEMDGEMDVKDGEGISPLRNRLMRLHTLHGRPGYDGSRWWWSLMVDLMGVAMILWGFTGLLMWWTVRPTRRSGAVALSVGVGVMCVLAASLWGALGMA